MPRFSHLFLIPILAAVSLVSASASAADLVVALKPDKNPEKMLEERGALTAFLSGKLGGTVSVIVPLSGAVIQEGLANGTIDVAYLSGTEMVQAIDAKTAALLLVGEIDGKTSYESLWVGRADSTATGVADLRGKSVAFASKSSTSGFLVPRWDLVQKGLLTAADPDPVQFFGAGNVFYGTGYVSAIERVLTNQADAAAVSDYVMMKDKHLTAEQKAALKIIARQGPVPTHCVAVRSSLTVERQAAVRLAVEALNEPANQALRDQLFTSKLVPAEATTHLTSVRAALALTGQVK